MALQSEGLYHATLAIAANTLGLLDPKYRVPALEHHNHALGYLRSLLKRDAWGEKELDEMLGLVLMLCWFDVSQDPLFDDLHTNGNAQISDNSRPSWVTHLNGFQDLIRTRQERPGRSAHSKELTNFFNRYFAFHLVLARTAFRVSSSSQDPPAIPDSILEAPDTIDPYMGFSPSLLMLINQVAELAWIRGAGQQNITAASVHQLKKSLEELDQWIPVEQIDPNMECAAIAEANRLGALLLLHEICSPKPVCSGTPHLPTLNVEEKNGYVEQILRLILTKKTNMMRTAVLPLWPLFLAGCCTRDEEKRVVVMQLFEELEAIRRFGVRVFTLLFSRPKGVSNNGFLYRILPRQWRLSRWYGASETSPCRMKESAREPRV